MHGLQGEEGTLLEPCEGAEESNKGRGDGRQAPGLSALSMLGLLTLVQGCPESCTLQSQIHGRCPQVFQSLRKQEGGSVSLTGGRSPAPWEGFAFPGGQKVLCRWEQSDPAPDWSWAQTRGWVHFSK